MSGPEEPRPAGLHFRVLGPLQVEYSGTPLAIGPPQARAILALLLVHRGTVVAGDRIIDELWAGRPPAHARVQVHGLISRLRHRLAAPAARGEASRIVTHAHGYLLPVAPGELDLDGFLDDLDAARRLRERGDVAASGPRLRSALNRWRGAAFAGITAPAVRAAADRLDELRLAAVEERVDADLAAGRARDLVPELGRLVARHPFRERLRGQLMLALATRYLAEGRVGEVGAPAQDALETFRQIDQPWGIGRCLLALGGAADAGGDPCAATGYYRQALAVWRRLGAPGPVAETLSLLDGLRGRGGAT